MLKVYGAAWCPHCTQTVDYLKQKNIAFEYIDIESQPESVVQEVIRVNGGDDWVVPTLEYNGLWREGKEFNPFEIASDLKQLGLTMD
ncbi:MAG: glutaredoxin family protein [Desulfobacterales bacterium]|nr:glutaredoxin family protein [Desulfobacterales bacterium]